MINRKNTQELQDKLIGLGLDLGTELEILDATQPVVADCYAILQCTRTLLSHGIEVPRCRLESGGIVIDQRWSMTGRHPADITATMFFDSAFRLMASAFSIVESEDKASEKKVTEFDYVDATMFVAVPELLGNLANYIYRMVFNSDYERDYAHFSMLELEPAKKAHAILLNGNAYVQLEEGHTSIIHPDTGIIDLIVLQVMVLINQYPGVDSLNFNYDPDLRVLVVDTDF